MTSQAAQTELSSLITPERLRAIFKLKMPFEKSNVPNGKTAWSIGASPEEVKAGTSDILIALSKIGLDNMPDLETLLPPPEDPEYPEQAAALVYLLDQVPRAIFHGVNARYTSLYFDPLVLKLSKQLLAVPAPLRADNLDRWLALGYSSSHWAMLKIGFIAPIAHSEAMEDQDVLVELAEDLRSTMERVTGTTDPYRGNGLAASRDVWAFSKGFTEGPPADENMETWVYWFCMILDSHPPIIRVFGRYPYRNGQCGRESSEEEKEYIEKTNRFGAIDDESAKLIREDVKAGVWRPLVLE